MSKVTIEDAGFELLEEAVVDTAEEEQTLLERIASRLILASVFLIPLFFIPVSTFSLPLSKAALLYFGIILVFCIWVIARLRDGQFLIPQTGLLASLGIFVIVTLLSALFSPSFTGSFIGGGVEVGTAINILLLSLLVFLVPLFIRAKEQVFGTYMALFLSFFVIALFHVLRFFFGADFLSFSLFTDPVGNMVGKWNDLGIFFGAIALLSLITAEFISLSRLFKIINYTALCLSLLFLAVINFNEVWWVLGLFSLMLFVYLIAYRRERESEEEAPQEVRRRIPGISLAVLLISVIFIIWGSALGGPLSTFFKIPPQIEARPSWQTTFSVAKEALSENLLLGSGPGTFVGEWLKYKPAAVNSTIFWNVDFNYGVGLIPTFLTTLGILGLLAWLTFFGFFCYAGFRAMLSQIPDIFSKYLITSSFLVALFLWVFSIIYIPSQTIFALAFLFTGLFLAALIHGQFVPLRFIPFVEKPKAGFVSVLLLILLLIGFLTLAFALSKRYVAAWNFERGVRAVQVAGNIDGGQKLIASAAALHKSDLYYRLLSELGLVRMNALLGRTAGTATADELRSEFQTLFGEALGAAREAVTLRPTNYENLIQLGRVYESVVPLKIEGAYENAKAAYDEAIKHNPRSPAIHLIAARLEMARENNAAARENIAKALAEKGNYTEAIFFLSQ
ncbi:MAG: hypothetical protein Q7R88_02995, partial [bacterium]|nr:hypothetical protein [bacterium]